MPLRAILLTAALASIAAPAFAAPPQVGILVEYIQLDHRSANKLIRKHATKLSAAPFREALEPILKSGEADLLESSYIVTRSGQRAKVGSNLELIYPTEFVAGSFSAEPQKKFDHDLRKMLSGIPPAFDVRWVGTILEVDPVISGNRKFIDINLAPEITAHLGHTRHFPFDDVPFPSTAFQPLFTTLRLSTAVTIRDRDVHFAGQLIPSPKVAPGKRILLFIHARILN